MADSVLLDLGEMGMFGTSKGILKTDFCKSVLGVQEGPAGSRGSRAGEGAAGICPAVRAVWISGFGTIANNTRAWWCEPSGVILVLAGV